MKAILLACTILTMAAASPNGDADRPMNGVETLITTLHMVQPTLSPDGRTIAFIRIDKKGADGESDVTSLWIADARTGAVRQLLGPSNNADPKLNIQSIQRPNWSLDGHYIYVLAADAWATSGAVHQINVETGADRYVIDGNTDQVIRTGPYRGYLLIERHKKAPGAGSYNPVDVVRPDGHVEFTVPGTEIDDGMDRVTPWLRQKGWDAW